MSAQETFDKHIHLSEAPTDSVLTLEFTLRRKKPRSPPIKTRRRTFIDFSLDELREIKLVVKGKKRLIWRP